MIEAREAELQPLASCYFVAPLLPRGDRPQWIDHLKAMEALREGIGLRGYGQKDPKQEYKKEGFVMFAEMMGRIGRNVCEKLFHMQVQREEAARRPVPVGRWRRPARRIAAAPQRKPRRTVESGGGAEPRAAQRRRQRRSDEAKPMRRDQPKVGRNDPCPCGSGKKYKKCHGAVATV